MKKELKNVHFMKSELGVIIMNIPFLYLYPLSV
jgi:hypothetical protein